MKKMTRNEFLKMAGTSAALVVFNTVLMPAAVAVEPGVVALSSKKSSIEIDKGTTVNSATFKLVPISRETFWGDAGSCTLDYLYEGYIQWTITVPGAVLVSFDGNLHFNKPVSYTHLIPVEISKKGFDSSLFHLVSSGAEMHSRYLLHSLTLE